ncbi:hypothetical protein BBJ28_00019216 [Nothophytophthora sp. Chile5]|nr:hypothetical protein BBJ28_00019216 [Nothophytophthora sp. Chile5]
MMTLAKSERLVVDASDSELAAQLALLRPTLTSYEMEFFRQLGKDCGEIIGQVARAIRPYAQNANAEKGFEGEWNYHHQDGCASYKSREWVANPSVDRVTDLNQAYAWNPSVAGTKSEDTILYYANANGEPVVEVISTSSDWPVLEHTIGDLTIARPGVLHLPY